MSTAFFAAIQRCDRWRVDLLLKQGVSINVRDRHGEHGLVHALNIPNNRKRPRMFRWLVDQGADILTVGRTSGRDVLIWAAILNLTPEVELILSEAGCELDARRRDAAGYTALHYATMNGNVEMVGVLCQHLRKYDLSVDIIDKDGLTPYILAVRMGETMCARALKNIGLASAERYDENSLQSSHFWEVIGEMERQNVRKAERQNAVALYKTFGRLPQLVASKYDVENLDVVLSEHERRALHGHYHARGKHDWLLRDSYNETPVRPHSDITASRGKMIRLPLLVASIDDVHTHMEKDSFHASDKPNSRSVAMSASPVSVSSLLDVMAEQTTGSFLPPAVAPPVEVDEPVLSPSRLRFGSAAHATTFSVRLKKKADKKARKGEKKAACFDKDRLPVIIPS